MTTATQTQITITDAATGKLESVTDLDHGLVVTIVLGDLSLDPSWVRAALEDGVMVTSAGRNYKAS